MQVANVRFLNNLRTLCTKWHHSTETNYLKCKEEFLLQHAWDWKPMIDILIVHEQCPMPKEALWCYAFKWSAHSRQLEVCFGSAQHHKTQQDTKVPEKRNWGIGGVLFVVLNPSYTFPKALGLEIYVRISLMLYHWPLNASNSLAVSWECCNSSRTMWLQPPAPAGEHPAWHTPS